VRFQEHFRDYKYGNNKSKFAQHLLNVIGPMESIMDIIRGVSKKFGEWHHKTNNTEDTNKLTLLAFKIIAILHNTLLATFIKLLETVTRSWIAATSEKRAPFMMLFRRGNRKKSTLLP
jgi:hypothetical protein